MYEDHSIEDDMAHVDNKWVVKTASFFATSSHKNVHKNNIKMNYTALTHHMAIFPLRNTMSTGNYKIWSLRSPTFGVKNVPLKYLRIEYRLCLDPATKGPEFNEILIESQTFSYQQTSSKMSSPK